MYGPILLRVLKNVLFVLVNFNIRFVVLFVSTTSIRGAMSLFTKADSTRKCARKFLETAFLDIMCGTELSA